MIYCKFRQPSRGLRTDENGLEQENNTIQNSKPKEPPKEIERRKEHGRIKNVLVRSFERKQDAPLRHAGSDDTVAMTSKFVFELKLFSTGLGL